MALAPRMVVMNSLVIPESVHATLPYIPTSGLVAIATRPDY